MKNYKFETTIDSTNSELKRIQSLETLPEFYAIRTGFQSAGKGQIGNSWEAQRGKNILFSMLLRPHHIAIPEQFLLSQIVSVAIVKVMQSYKVECEIKWPNDIYVGDKKLGGILIENSLRGSKIDYSIIGVGLNINQSLFKSNAPNPISTFSILSKKIDLKKLFVELIEEIKQLYLHENSKVVKSEYKQYLYRKNGFFNYKYPDNKLFEAEINSIEDNGKLWLRKRSGEVECFYFKEVEFVLP